MALRKILEREHRVRHRYMPGTPHVSLEFAYAAGLFRLRSAANGGFVDTGRPNSFNTPRFNAVTPE